MVGGKTIISEEVFIELAKIVMAKVECVVASNGESGAFAAFAKRVAERVVPPVVVKKVDAISATEDVAGVEGHVSFEIKVKMLYGSSIPDTIDELRAALVKEIETITGYQVDRIDVIVDRLVKEEEFKVLSEEVETIPEDKTEY
jgi:uncharacterized alkaline shock family protein YloU